MTDHIELKDLIREYRELLVTADGEWIRTLPRDASSSIKSSSDLICSDARLRALERLKRISEIEPAKPWVWFQIGWNSFAFPEDVQDLETARSALERALHLDPDNAITHIVLAWLLYQQEANQLEEGNASLQSIWDGPIGAHLRGFISGQGRGFTNVGDAEGPESEVSDAFEVSDVFNEDTFYISYGDPHEVSFPLGRTRKVVNACLDTMFEIIPEEYRCSYCIAAQRLPLDRELPYHRRHWLEQALAWAGDDNQVLFDIHWDLAQVNLDFLADYPYLDKYFAELLEASKYLLRLPYDSDGAPGRYDLWFREIPFPEGHTLEQTDLVVLAGDDFGGHGPFLRDWKLLVELARASKLLGANLPRQDDTNTFRVLEHLVGVAARLLMDHGYLEHAKRYLQGCHIIRELWVQSLDPKQLSMIRSSPAREVPWWAATSREIMMREGNYESALAENDFILQSWPEDPTALALKKLLEIVIRQPDLRPALQAISSISSQLDTFAADMRAGQDLILDELAFQHGILKQAAHIQASLPQSQGYRIGDEDGQYTRVLDELHRLIQEGSRIQPSVWQATQGHVRVDLGEEVFNGLADPAQHFLVTAEVFFNASQDVADRIDAGLISVEYAKVVEVQLRDGLLASLGRYLDRRNYGGRIYGREEIRRTGRWAWDQTLSSLTLGTTANMLDKAATGSDNEIALKFLDAVGLSRPQVRKLADDIKLISDSYRNGAAHTKALKRSDLEAFRNLLFAGGLLRRLVDLSRRSTTAV